ncbi:MAG: hypothetical protein ABIP63_05725, partial [Thermoanaerobaculia bacterium]
MERIAAIRSLRRSGKFIGGGGFEARVVQENRRPQMVREEFAMQGMTGINAWDGKVGWKIEPWDGKKDPEALSEAEQKEILEDSDFEGPLINYRQKGNRVEYLGREPVEGTDAYKLRVTRRNGDVQIYYMDSDYYVPIKIETKRMIRGAEREFETSLGDYKEVSGWFLPFSIESNVKGSSNRQKIAYEKIEANVALGDERFARPMIGKTPTDMQPDASTTSPRKSETAKPAPKPPQPQRKPEGAGR